MVTNKWWASQENPLTWRSTRRCTKDTRASIKIAALNIKGYGATAPDHPNNKWLHVNQIMRERKIGILAVGEAHMNKEQCDEIEKLHGSRLKIIYSRRTDTANRGGVAFVLNKSITNTEGLVVHEIVPGHALLLETKWHGSEKLSILAIYAPNDTERENAEFWPKINNFFTRNHTIRRPDTMLGDFNMVEESIDRLPAHLNNWAAINALDDLKTLLQMMDGWRNTFPDTLNYTYKQVSHRGSPPSHSRINRIYMKPTLYEHALEWKIESAGIPTDHKMISVKVSCDKAPMIGKGRWCWPAYIIHDKITKDYIHQRGLKLQNDMDFLQTLNTRSSTDNPQRMWASFKKDIGKMARMRAKITMTNAHYQWQH
ncbi:MAG: hypothetical protein NXY57DRAFT_1105185 [Lentinula lateritia]|nr:MAG: hypothetical protein NXY57DRAFT_1105185 [Lentinula lateritia]